MKTTSIVGVWLTLIVTVVVETIVYYRAPGSYLVEAVIALLASGAAVTTATFSMGLKDEEGAIRLMLLVPVALLAVLALTMLLSYQVSY